MIYKDDDKRVMLIHNKREYVTKSMHDNSVDLVLEDPPYGIRAENWDDKNNYIKSLTDWLFEALRISKSTVIWFMGNEGLIYVSQAITGYENYFHRILVWNKPEGSQYSGASNNNIWYSHELIIVFTKNADITKKYGRKEPFKYSVMSYRTVPYNEYKHPTSKPVKLLIDLIKHYSKPGDTVFDGFGGSFSTAVACIRTNRRIISCEQNPIPNMPINEDLLDENYNPDYYNRGVARVKNELSQPTIFEEKQIKKQTKENSNHDIFSV